MRRDEFHAPDKKNFLMKTIIFVAIHLQLPTFALPYICIAAGSNSIQTIRSIAMSCGIFRFC